MDKIIFTDEYDDSIDFKHALNFHVSGTVIAFIKLGRWNGHRYAVAEAQTTDMRACTRWCNEDINTWYVDDFDFCSKHAHYDSTHYIIYRERRPDVTDAMITNMRRLAESTKNFDREIMERCTTSLREKVLERFGIKDDI